MWALIAIIVVLWQFAIFGFGLHLATNYAEETTLRAIGYILMVGAFGWAIVDRRRERNCKPPGPSAWIAFFVSGLLIGAAFECKPIPPRTYPQLRAAYADSLQRLAKAWHSKAITDDEWTVIDSTEKKIRDHFENAKAEAVDSGRVSDETLKTIDADLTALERKAAEHGGRGKTSGD